MNDVYLWIKLLHILSSTVLFGTGLGTAFHMWFAHLNGDPRSIATVARNVVIADFLFTTPTVIVQPITGVALFWLDGFDPLSSWLVVTYFLYVIAGGCWLPVVWLQIKVRDAAREAVTAGLPLPAPYYRYMKIWFALGWPAFGAVIAIFWLMVTKPAIW
jgi:uncharacterized membrane protein